MNPPFTRVAMTLAACLLIPGLAAAHTLSGTPRADTQTQATLLVAAKCKYKTDGTGNCLSPAFYRCQKAWTKCTEACGGKLKCIDACELKFAPQCGD